MNNYFRNNWNTPGGYREVLRVGLPLTAGMISSMVMQFTDRLFLSRYSMEAIAASMPASIASMTLHMTMLGICGYSGVLAAQYIGARAPHRVGPAIWQGIWCAVLCTVILVAACFMAPLLFSIVGHEPEIQTLEVQYFITITAGASFALIGAAISGYFFGRGLTKPVMVANMIAAVINVPLDYALIFGAWGFPELGIIGAGIATTIGWIFTALVLALLVFTRKIDAQYHVRRGWRFEKDMFKRLIRYGLPSGANMLVEFAAMSWFIFQIGSLGKIPLAASNIAFSVNSLTFMPMIGLNMATATLVGQAMGKKAPFMAEKITWHALHLAFLYMIAVAALIVIFAGPLMEIFRTGSENGQSFEPVKSTGIILFYYVALYSVVDAANLIFIGALKGAGDTVAMMKIIISCVACFLFVPMIALIMTDNVSLHPLWIIFSSYIFILALVMYWRFRGRKWHKINMVDDVQTGAEETP
ncbi:MATE family efflux transporter [Desulfovibrio sp. OttesenSCG-928-C06]|nr:MATE family efflux transporter [Desulfovibrio sp. OttesenSCG-928-C06]